MCARTCSFTQLSCHVGKFQQLIWSEPCLQIPFICCFKIHYTYLRTRPFPVKERKPACCFLLIFFSDLWEREIHVMSTVKVNSFSFRPIKIDPNSFLKIYVSAPWPFQLQKLCAKVFKYDDSDYGNLDYGNVDDDDDDNKLNIAMQSRECKHCQKSPSVDISTIWPIDDNDYNGHWWEQ